MVTCLGLICLLPKCSDVTLGLLLESTSFSTLPVLTYRQAQLQAPLIRIQFMPNSDYNQYFNTSTQMWMVTS